MKHHTATEMTEFGTKRRKKKYSGRVAADSPVDWLEHDRLGFA
jgi:hypothetical protein